MLGDNEDFCNFLKEKEIIFTCELGEGGHEWDFGDRYIKKSVEWLPINKSGLVISSGNVGI